MSMEINRRHLLRAAPAVGFAALVAGAVPVEAASHDPLVDLCRRFTEAYDALGVELKKPEAGNFDTPECLRLMAIKDELAEQIEATPITTVAGASALLDFIWLDCGVEGSDWVDLQMWAFVKLRSWANAEARGLMGELA